MSMFTPMQLLRLRNLFPPQSQQSQEDDESQYDVNKYYNPSNTAMNALVGGIQDIPRREQYQPSKMRKLGSVIGGLGAGVSTEFGDFGPMGIRTNPKAAFEMSEAIADKPFHEAVEDWSTKIKPLEVAAQREEFGNRNARMFAEQTVQRNINAAREKRLTTEGQTKLDQAQQKIAISGYRAAAYDYSKRHPNHKFQEDDQGNLIALDPATGKSQVVTDDDGNPVKSSKLPEKDRINLEIGGRIQAIKEGGAQRRETEQFLEGARGRLKQIPSPAMPPVSETATQRDAAGNVVGSIERTRTRGQQPQQMPQGFYKGQRIKGKNGQMGTLDGVNPDGTPKITWDKK